MGLQAMLRLVYPPQCLGCDELVTSDFGLCGRCWRETPFIAGVVCDTCGLPLPGDDATEVAQCDDCLTLTRPWVQGRAALLYKDNGRKMVLQLKHGDRLDLAKPAGSWLLRAAKPMLRPDTLLAPVPLHWFRMLRRRYNQSALLAASVGRLAGIEHCPDLLIRHKRTPSQEGRDRHARFENLQDAIRVHPRRVAMMKGRKILLVDDVMTSGATLAAATDACLAAGAAEVRVLVLARVAKDA
ncbi:double zinc ribbon domain-containing protein [Pseudorhodobacter sp. W20_MBD10_FR17]|uniref:double zinc ribbon domain-containing protein n=1 Tax=Pseudorhodobacter sp. W20_MBD10_FR17 TaxID=3240266 RepID=UPI003F9D01D9